jgi:glutathione synthase/RimK-type ligase-like ATP-grasp enzyme
MRGSVIVPYDLGSVPPTTVGQLAQKHGLNLIFFVADSPHSEAMTPILTTVGSVARTRAQLSELIDAGRRDHGDLLGLVTYSEAQLGVAAQLARELGLPYNSVETVGVLMSKFEQRRAFREHGLEVPRCVRAERAHQLTAAAAELTFPLVLKPDFGWGSRHTSLVSSPDELAQCMAELPDGMPFVAEEMIRTASFPYPWGDYMDVECFAADGKVVALFASDKFALVPPFRERGGFAPPLPDRDIADVCETACAAVAAVGVTHGIACVELKLTDQGPVVIEVNGRLGGWTDKMCINTTGRSLAETALLAAFEDTTDTSAAFASRSDRVYYEYELVPPIWATQVRDDASLTPLRSAAPGARVVSKVRPGQAVDWRSGSLSSLAALSGSTADHRELSELVARLDVEAANLVT